MDMLQLPRQASSGQEPGTSGQAAVDSTGYVLPVWYNPCFEVGNISQ